MTECIADFIRGTRQIQSIRAEHAPRLKSCRAAKKTAQARLHGLLKQHEVSCVGLGNDKYARIKTCRSMRALVPGMVVDAVGRLPMTDILGASLEVTVGNLVADLQRVRCVNREYAAIESIPGRDGVGVVPDAAAVATREAADGYRQAVDALKESTRAMKVDIGGTPVALREHEAEVTKWLDAEGLQSQHLTLDEQGVTGKFYLRRKESKRKPRIDVKTIGALATKALRSARRSGSDGDDIRAAFAQELLRQIQAIPSTVVSKITLDRARA